MMKKRVFAIMIAMCILIGIVPFNTYAYTQGYDGMGPVVINGGQRDFIWPVPGYYNLQSCFYDQRNHCALDIAAPVNTSAVASYSGTVLKAVDGGTSYYGDGFGNYVVLQHSYALPTGTVTLYTRYSHLNSVSVREGTSVYAGAEVGKIGTTGSSGGYHLDFQILYGSWQPYQTYSIDPYANQLLELPSNLEVKDSWPCGSTYYALVKELYATAVQCNHAYTNEITTPASCVKDGLRTYTCSKCGDSYTETIPANGEHNYGVWQTVTEAGCVTEGLQTRACACGATQTRETAALGHDAVAYYIPATCIEPEFIHYECRRCGALYNEYGGEWSEIKPSGVPEDQIETKIQYRYSDFITTQSYIPDLEGYELVDSQWMETATGSVKYAKSCPSGFDTTNNVYAQYKNSPKTNAETNTEKVTVNSEEVSGYIYWHWCRGTYTGGPIDRKTSEYWTSEFNAFHAFFSTTSPDGMFSVGDGSVTFPNGDCCKDSHWYYSFPVYTQTYTTYEKLFTYGRWGVWSEWSDTGYTATDTRKVEDRTVYRYVSGELAECSWDDGIFITEPTCTSAGVKLNTCTFCGGTKTQSVAATGHNYQDGYCTKCDAQDPDYSFVAAKVQIGTVSGKPGDTVTVPVSISDNPGIAGFTFVFDYDTSAMTLTGISKANVLQDGTFTPNVAGKTLNWFNAVNVTENGVLFNLTFKLSEAAAVGDYSVTAALKDGKNTNFVNENAKAQRITFESGKVSVQNRVTLTSVAVETLPQKTSYECGESLDTTGLTLKLTYSDGTSETVTTGFAVSGFDSITAGTKTVTVIYEGKTATFTVTVTEPEPEIDENAPQIAIKSKKVAAGKEFTITAEVKNNPGFSYLEVTPVYSPELTLVKVENGDLFSDFTKGKQYVWIADEDVAEDGLLLTFTFKTAEDVKPGDYKVSFKVRTCANYDEEAVTLSVVDATVEVIEFVYGDVTGDGKIDGFDVIRLKKYLANYDYDTETSTVEVTAGADATGDGKIDGFDVIRLKKYLANYDYETGESTIVLGPQ